MWGWDVCMGVRGQLQKSGPPFRPCGPWRWNFWLQTPLPAEPFSSLGMHSHSITNWMFLCCPALHRTWASASVLIVDLPIYLLQLFCALFVYYMSTL